MKQYNNGQRKGMMYGGMSRRKPMMYGGTATKPRKKAQMGGMMQSAPMMQPQKQEKPTMQQPALSMNMAKGGMAKSNKSGKRKFAALAPPYDKVTYADKIAGATGIVRDKDGNPVRDRDGNPVRSGMMYGGKAKTRG